MTFRGSTRAVDRGDECNWDKFLEGLKYMAMLRALFPQATFISRNCSIRPPVNLRSASLISEIDALIDSGATDNFILPAVVTLFKIPTQPLEQPQNLRNIDGVRNLLLKPVI
jgi:hypothetical protein